MGNNHKLCSCELWQVSAAQYFLNIAAQTHPPHPTAVSAAATKAAHLKHSWNKPFIYHNYHQIERPSAACAIRNQSVTDCSDFYFVCPGFGRTAGDFLATYTSLFFFPLLTQRWPWQQLLAQCSQWSETRRRRARRQLAVRHSPAPDKQTSATATWARSARRRVDCLASATIA